MSSPCDIWTAAKNGDVARLSFGIAASVPINSKDKNGWTPLYKAAENGHGDAVQALVDASADVHVKDQWGYTPLHRAVENGHSGVVQVLVSADADFDAEEDHRFLLFAAVRGDVASLIERKANVNVSDDLVLATPLHLAAMFGHTDAAQMLIAAKATVTIKDKNGRTPFHWAAEHGHLDTMRVLLSAKADPKAKDWNDYTPMQRALMNGHNGAVQLLIDAGVAFDGVAKYEILLLMICAYRGNNSTLRHYMKGKADVNACDNIILATPLHLAAMSGQTTSVQILIDSKALINAKDCCAKTPLHRAAENGHTDTLQVLIKAKANVDVKDWNDHTPLHCAAVKGYKACVQALVAARADITLRAHDGRTALQSAESRGQTETANLLRVLDMLRVFNIACDDVHNFVEQVLSLKGSLEWRTVAGRTPLMEAVLADNADAVKVLVDANASIMTSHDDGETPFSCALKRGYVPTIKALANAVALDDAMTIFVAAMVGDLSLLLHSFDARVPLDRRTFDDRTPLMLAASHGHTEVVRVMITAGAQLDMVDKYGDTALILAATNDHADIVHSLIDAKASTAIVNKAGKTLLDVALARENNAILQALGHKAM